MPIDRFYLDHPLQNGSCVALADQEFHHLANVTRVKPGDLIELINGKGILAEAEVLELKKREATLKILSNETFERSPFSIIIAQAIPRINRLETIVEKSTELGMNALWLFAGKRSEKKDLKQNQLARLKNILIAATKQSGRLFIPTISLIDPINNWKPLDLPLYFGDLLPDAPPFLNEWDCSSAKKGVIFCIGPERGLDQTEISKLKELQGIGVKLHQNILRTDTAPLAALALIAHARL